MLAALLQQADFVRPDIDWHALAPELTLLGVGALVTLIDVVFLEKARKISPTIAGLGLLAVLIPIITLAVAGVASNPRAAFAGSDVYVVDGYSLILKALFILIGYMVVLMSTNYIGEGDYWESEYYGMLISSLLGMVVMASARDLITVFVALELLSIPAYLMATWRKRDIKSNEAGLKYYLNGVFASALMLFGMSILFGVTGSTVLSEINAFLMDPAAASDQMLSEALLNSSGAIITLGIVLVIVGFAFKVSAVPFHLWAPDTYEGSPTPVTAFLAVAAKSAGFVALMNLIFVGFLSQNAVYAPALWILAALSMTIGNLTALRQENLIRLMAYSGIAQAGFMLAALSVAGEGDVAQRSVSAVVTYLIIYAAMNLGAFSVILTVSRRTQTAHIRSFNGLFQWSPALAIIMTIFLASLAGIPPLGGWFAKFGVFTALIEADLWWAYVLAGLAAVNTVIAFGYYGKLASRMWFEDAPTEFETTPIRVPFALQTALVITAVTTIAFGVYPSMITHFSDVDVPAAIAAAVDG